MTSALTQVSKAVAVAGTVAVAVWWHHKMVAGLREQMAGLEEDRMTLAASIPVQRKAAVKASRAVNTGMMTQDIAPLLPDWPWALKDTRQVGAPLDYIVFDGMEQNSVGKIVFVEVKSGNARITSRQRQIKTAIEEGRVEFKTYTPQRRDTNAIINGDAAKAA